MRPVDLLRALAVMAIWGFNFAVSKVTLEQFQPLTAMVLRFTLVAVVLLPFVAVPRGKLRQLLGYSVVMGGLHFPLVFTGVQGVDASIASIAIQMQVPFASLLAAVFLKDALGWRRAAGMAVAFLGVVVIAGEPRASANLFSLGLVVAAAFCFSFSNIQLKWMGGIDPFTLNAYMALFAVPQLVVLSLLLETGQVEQIMAADWLGWACIGYMGLVSTILAYWFWTPLVARYPVNQTMPFLLLVPVFGVGSGVLVLGEPLTWHLFAGGALTLAGVAAVILRRPKIIEARTTT
ncbi:MAG TPA: EamA family transporter [Azospirillaceae bacterium]|nr:EamA family transporter [Azospirillaceae bacterium]